MQSYGDKSYNALSLPCPILGSGRNDFVPYYYGREIKVVEMILYRTITDVRPKWQK